MTPSASTNGTSKALTADFGTAHVAHGVGRLTPMIMSKAKGVYVWDENDKKYLDMTCGIAVTNLGHCHEGVTKAAQEQVATMVHAQVNIGFSAAYLRLIESFLPHLANLDPSLDSVFLWNSGAEAVEASIKLARAATKKQNVIVMQGSYHGRTFGTMALTRSKTIYGLGFAPLMPGVFTTPFPFYSQFGLPESTPTSELVQSSLHQLELLLAQQTAPTDTAAIILEPVLGEGGYVPAPDEFMRGLRAICDKYDILLICDEIQCGIGRTGKFFFTEYSGVRPDILVFAKGIANGFPLSGIVSRKELMDLQKPGTMGGTYGGNAVACAAARAVLKAFEEEKILDNVAARSKQVFDFLHEFMKTKEGSVIQQVRGHGGLMVGIQFVNPKMKNAQTLNASSQNSTAASNGSGSSKAASEAWLYHSSDASEQLAPKVVQECIKRNMLILSTSCFDVIRMIPPLNVTQQEMQQGLEIFAESVKTVAKSVGV